MVKQELKEAASELETVKRKGLYESTKQSMAGWSQILGMTRLRSLLIDSVSCVIGYLVATSFSGVGEFLGYAVLAIGAVGIITTGIKTGVEKL